MNIEKYYKIFKIETINKFLKENKKIIKNYYENPEYNTDNFIVKWKVDNNQKRILYSEEDINNVIKWIIGEYIFYKDLENNKDKLWIKEIIWTFYNNHKKDKKDIVLKVGKKWWKKIKIDVKTIDKSSLSFNSFKYNISKQYFYVLKYKITKKTNKDIIFFPLLLQFKKNFKIIYNKKEEYFKIISLKWYNTIRFVNLFDKYIIENYEKYLASYYCKNKSNLFWFAKKNPDGDKSYKIMENLIISYKYFIK